MRQCEELEVLLAGARCERWRRFMNGPTQPCGNCKQPVNLKTDHWVRRRVNGRWCVVHAGCARAIDTQRELEQDLAVAWGVAS